MADRPPRPHRPAGWARRCVKATTVRARSSAVVMTPSWRTARRWLGVSRKPPALTTAASPAARDHGVERHARGPQALGVHQHLVLLVALAPDGDVRHAGHGHQPRAHRPAAPVRSVPSARASWSDRPIFIARLSDEYGAMSTGGLTTVGRRVCASASRSCTSCRARTTSVPVLENHAPPTTGRARIWSGWS